MPRICAGRTVANRSSPWLALASVVFFSALRRPALVACVLLCLASAAAHGADLGALFADKRVGAGVDVVHDRGAPVLSASAGFASLLAWRRHSSGNNFGVGLAFPIGNPEGFNFGLGGMLIDKTDDLIGTHLNFLARASYCRKTFCLSAVHLSHGRIFGLDKEAANGGLNFVFLEYRLK